MSKVAEFQASMTKLNGLRRDVTQAAENFKKAADGLELQKLLGVHAKAGKFGIELAPTLGTKELRELVDQYFDALAAAKAAHTAIPDAERNVVIAAPTE